MNSKAIYIFSSRAARAFMKTITDEWVKPSVELCRQRVEINLLLSRLFSRVLLFSCFSPFSCFHRRRLAMMSWAKRYITRKWEYYFDGYLIRESTNKWINSLEPTVDHCGNWITIILFEFIEDLVDNESSHLTKLSNLLLFRVCFLDAFEQ